MGSAHAKRNNVNVQAGTGARLPIGVSPQPGLEGNCQGGRARDEAHTAALVIGAPRWRRSGLAARLRLGAVRALRMPVREGGESAPPGRVQRCGQQRASRTRVMSRATAASDQRPGLRC